MLERKRLKNWIQHTVFTRISVASKKNAALILSDVEEASPAIQVLDLDQI